jgi:HK97 family phage major capsid protein
MTSSELREKRKRLVDEARRVMQPALDEGRGLTSEEDAKVGAIDVDIDKLGKMIDQIEKVERLERAFVPDSQRETAAVTPQADAQTQYRDAFWGYVRGRLSPTELRAMSVGTDTYGGYTVPDEFRRELITGLDELNVMRGLSTVITSSSGTMTVPKLSTHAAATWTAEGVAYTETTPVFDEITFSAYKAGAYLTISEELLNDSAFPLEQFIAKEFARALAELEETAFVVGTGSTHPTGVVVGSTLGKTATATNAITADELMDLQHSLGRGYRRNAVWLMKDASKATLRKLVTGVSGDKTYIWQPGLSNGEPDVLLGAPVYTSPDMAGIATGEKAVLYGDFKYYYIVDRQSISVQRLNELYSANGQIGFRIFKRTDGKLVLATAVNHLKLA